MVPVLICLTQIVFPTQWSSCICPLASGALVFLIIGNELQLLRNLSSDVFYSHVQLNCQNHEEEVRCGLYSM